MTDEQTPEPAPKKEPKPRKFSLMTERGQRQALKASRRRHRPELKRPTNRKLLDSRGIRSILYDIEEAAGGREQLLASFKCLDLTEREEKWISDLEKWVDDPVNDRSPLHRGLSAINMPFKLFIQLFRDAIVAPLKFQTELALAAQMPTIMQKTVADAQEIWRICPECSGNGGTPERQCFHCEGTGRRKNRTFCPPCEGSGTLSPRTCNICGGTGKVVTKINMESRKLAFEAAGLTGSGKEVRVAVQANVTVPTMEQTVRMLPTVEAIDVLPEDN